MLSDTTAPAEELQDKLATLEQLLLAYGRVAIGFSGGVDSSFLAAVCARIMPASTLLVHLTTPLIGTPEQASFERSVDVQASEEPHFKLPVLNLSVDQLQLPQVACNDANPLLPLQARRLYRHRQPRQVAGLFHRHRWQQCKRSR